MTLHHTEDGSSNDQETAVRHRRDNCQCCYEDLAAALTQATKLARDIHQKLKRGERTKDHGLIENLRCILDHVCSPDDPPPI